MSNIPESHSWLDGWQKQLNISVNNTLSYPIIKYPINLTVDGTNFISNGMDVNGHSFRITINDQEQSFYNFTNFSRADVNIIFKVNLTEFENITSIQIYYNNPTANFSYYNLSDVYSLVDHFLTADSVFTNNPRWENISLGSWNIISGTGILTATGILGGSNQPDILCAKGVNLTTGFVADFRQIDSSGVAIAPIFYFNESGTASTISDNKSYMINYDASQSRIDFNVVGNFITGLRYPIARWFNNWSTADDQTSLLRRRLEIQKPNFTTIRINFSVQSAGGLWNSTGGNSTGQDLFNFTLTDRNVHATSGSFCLQDLSNSNSNEFSNVTLYQDINPYVAEDLPYIINYSHVYTRLNPNVTIRLPGSTVTNSNFLLNMTANVLNTLPNNSYIGSIDYCYYNVTFGSITIVSNRAIANCVTNDSNYVSIITGDGNYKISVFANDTFGQNNQTEFKVIALLTGAPNTVSGSGGGATTTNIVYNGSFSLEQKTIDKYVIYTDFDGNEQVSTIALLTGNRNLIRCSTTGSFKCGQLDQNKVPLLLSYQTKGLHLDTLLEDLLGKNIKGTVTVNADTGEVITKEVNVKVIDITLGIQVGDFNVRLIWLVIGGAAFYLFNLLRSPSRVRIKVTR